MILQFSSECMFPKTRQTSRDSPSVFRKPYGTNLEDAERPAVIKNIKISIKLWRAFKHPSNCANVNAVNEANCLLTEISSSEDPSRGVTCRATTQSHFRVKKRASTNCFFTWQKKKKKIVRTAFERLRRECHDAEPWFLSRHTDRRCALQNPPTWNSRHAWYHVLSPICFGAGVTNVFAPSSKIAM